MSALAQLLVYGLVLLAVVAGVQGAWLTVQTYLGEGRAVSRRLTRAVRGAPAPVAPTMAAFLSEEEPSGPLDRVLDARAPWIRQRLVMARAPFTPAQLALGAGGMTAFFLLLLALSGVPFVVALALAVWAGCAGPILMLSWMAGRRRKRFVEQMPQAVDLIARSLQAGHPVTTSISVVARQMSDPIGPEFATVIAEMQAGLDRDVALRNLLARFPLPELRMFVASLEVTRETGGNLAEVFLKLGDTIRAKAQLRKKVAAISAEGKMTFWVVSALPFVVGGAIFLINPAHYKDVAGDPLFMPLMMIPPVLLLTGALIIWRLINFKI